MSNGFFGKRAAMGALFILVTGSIAAIGCDDPETAGGGTGEGLDGSSASSGTGGSGGVFDIAVCTSQSGTDCRFCCEAKIPGPTWGSYHDSCLECQACAGACTCGASNQTSECYSCMTSNNQNGFCQAEADAQCSNSPVCVKQQECIEACPPAYGTCRNLYIGYPACPGSQELYDVLLTCKCQWSAFEAEPLGCAEYCGGTEYCDVPGGGAPNECYDCVSANCQEQLDACNNDEE